MKKMPKLGQFVQVKSLAEAEIIAFTKNSSDAKVIMELASKIGRVVSIPKEVKGIGLENWPLIEFKESDHQELHTGSIHSSKVTYKVHPDKTKQEVHFVVPFELLRKVK